MIAGGVTLINWRLGCFLWLAAAILQDPIRKVTPGTPAYLTLAFLPIYLAAFYGAVKQRHGIKQFIQHFPRLFTRFQLFGFAILCSLIVAVTYTGHGVMAAGLGVMSYVGAIPSLLLGYWYLQREYKELEPLLVAFVIITSLMLVGVPLEHLGYKFSQPWLGTIASDRVWYRWFNDFDYVAMLSGFHRSPEIMGWHAMALTLISYYLVLKRPKFSWLWSFTAVWGVYAVFMSGRRKMLLMMIAFILVFFWTSSVKNRRKIMLYIAIGVAILLPALAYFVDELYLKSLDSGVAITGSKLTEKGFRGPLWLAGFVGPFGFGVGSITQGAQHVSQRLQNMPLVEGGVEKIMVELGLVGLLCTLVFAYELVRTAYRSVRQAAMRTPLDFGPQFCFAFVAANMVAFLIAFQFLGDPFIGSFIGFMFGLVLSYARLVAKVPVVESPANYTLKFRQTTAPRLR